MSTDLNNILTDDAAADEVLVAFAEAGPSASVAEWASRHPRFARDFARLAADRWAGDGAALADAAAAQRLAAVGLATLRACRPQMAAQAAQSEVIAFSSLLDAAAARGLDIDALAARLSLTEQYVVKLHRRLFAPDSLPRTLVQNLADAVGRATADVAAYLAMPPRLAAGASYRADGAPSVGEQEDFAATLKADPELTDAQRALYLSAGGDGE
jgi:hypothetical protein